MPAATPTLLTAKDKAPDTDGSYFLETANLSSTITIRYGGVDYSATSMAVNAYNSDNGWEKRSTELVAVASNVVDGAVVFTAAWKQTSTYGTGSSASTNVNWSFTELKASGSGTQLTDTLISSGAKSAPYETFFGTSAAADLNKDGVVGPKNLTTATTDTAGVKLARDADGSVYIQDTDGGTTKNVLIRDGQYQNNYSIEQADNTWGDTNNGGGNSNKIFAVGKGSPKAWALTQSSQVAAAFDSATSSLDFNNNDNGYWALRKGEYWNTSNGVKTTSSVNWSLLKIGSDGNLLGTSYTVPVGWLEGYFGQELNGDGVLGADLKWKTKGGGGTAASPSGLQIAQDADGASYLVKSYTNKADLESLSDNSLLMIKTAEGYPIKGSYSVMGQEVYGSETAKLVSVTENGTDNHYLYVRNYRITNAGTSSAKETNTGWQAYKLTLTKDSGAITGVTANWDRWLDKIGAEEINKDADIDGNGVIGAGTPTALPNATDTVNETLGVDNEGSYYIVRPGSTPLAITNGKSMFEDSTWQTKAPVAVVKAQTNDVISGWTSGNYYALTKTVYNQGGKPQFQIDEIDAKGEWKSTKQWLSNNDRLSKFEEVFDQDLNGDGQKTTASNPIVPTVVSTDNYDASKTKYNNGVAVAKDGDGRIFVVTASYTNGAGTPTLTDLKPVVYMGGSIPDLENGWSNTTERYERKIIAAEKVDNKDEYLLATKNTRTILSTNKVEVTWDISLLKTAAGLSSSSGTGGGSPATMGYAGTGTYYATMAGGSDVPNALYITETTNTGTIAGREREFGQDLNGDGKIGIDLANLAKLSTDKYGVRLAKDADGALYISQVKNNVESAVALSGGMMGQLESTNNWEIRTAVAAEAKRSATGDIEYYRVAVLKKSNYNTMSAGMPGTAATTASTDTSTWQKSWDILQFDTTGKMVYGSMDNGQWKDVNLYNQKSISDFEEFFKEDLNNDGRVGVNAAALTMALLDTQGARLARNTNDNSIYIVEGVGEAAKAKSIRTSGGDLEYKNTWGGAAGGMGGNSREAVAVEAVKDSAGTVTGYRLAMKEKYTNWDGKDNVTWSILKLDAKGAVTYGQWNADKGYYVDENVYGLKSISSYEADWFNDDLNGDGQIGIDAASLKMVDTDSFGVKLARDSEKSLYIVEGKSVKSIDSSWLEYENSWGSGSNKKEAVAVEAVRDASGAITGYKLALKQTDNYDGKETIRWEVMTLGSDGKMNKGGGAMAMTAGGSSTYTNSIAPYESLFGQDLNGDGRVGVDVSTLTKGTTDQVGVTFARDAESALYLIKTDGTAMPIGNSSWLEYENNWGNGYNKSEIYAVEAMSSGGYKVAVKRSNAWYASAEDKATATVTVTWDLMQLDAQGQMTYGYTGANNTWINTSLWGLKSLVPYEVDFRQDFNGDGVTGIDFNALKNYAVSTDTAGVRLYRDKDNALYIVNDPANPTSIKAIGNASYLEYDYSWNTNSNKVEAYAVEAVTVNNAITGYKLVLKQTNVNNGQTDLNWQILRLDVDGNVNWSMSPSGGGNIWTKKISQVETAIQQDTPEDTDSIVGIDQTQLVSASPSNSGDATDSIALVKSSDGSIFIKDTRSGSNLIALVDAYGNSPNLEYSYTMGGSTSQAQLMGVAANGSNYRVALKTTSGSNVNWQFYNISAEGVLDWSKVINTRNASKYETAFQQEFDGANGFGLQVNLTALDTDPTVIGSTDAFLKIDEASNTVYIADGSSTVAIVDPNGGSPNFNYSRTGYESQAYAVHKLTAGGYLLAVEKTTTDGASDSVNWEVYKLSAAANGEATVNWSQTKYLTNLADVEELLQKDTIADADTVVGYPEEAAVVVSTDMGTYQAALTTTGALHLFKYENNAVSQDISVLDDAGLAVRLEKNSTWDAASSFTAKVIGAEAIFDSTSPTTLTGYKVVVKETTIIDGGQPDQVWKIYTVGVGASSNATTTAVISTAPVVSHSMVTWEDTFKQDLNGDGSDKGVDALVTTAVSTDSKDVSLDATDALYVGLNGDWVPVLAKDLGAVSYDDTQSFSKSTLDTHVVAAEWVSDTQVLIVEQSDLFVGTDVTTNWVIHTATYNSTTQEAIIDETKTVITDDMSAFATVFNQSFVPASPVI